MIRQSCARGSFDIRYYLTGVAFREARVPDEDGFVGWAVARMRFGCRVSPQTCARTPTRTSPHSPTVSKVSEVLDPSPRELPEDAYGIVPTPPRAKGRPHT